MRYRDTFFIAAAGLLAAGCSSEALPFEPGYTPAENSIGSYMDPMLAEASIRYWHEATGIAGDGQATYDQMQIEFYAGGLYPEQAFPDFAQRITPRSAPERYDSLTRAHQDYDYWGNPALSAYDVVFKGITAIDIVSDTDYDAQHPAGTSLKDIFTLTIQEVVKGATDGIPAYVFKETVYDPSSDFPAEGGPHLLGRVLTFKPTKAPAKTATHVFTITYQNERGKVLSAQTKAFKIKL